MSESLRNDGRIWAPKNSKDCEKDPNSINSEYRDYFLERMYPAFANLVPRDIASRAVKQSVMREEESVEPFMARNLVFI